MTHFTNKVLNLQKYKKKLNLVNKLNTGTNNNIALLVDI